MRSFHVLALVGCCLDVTIGVVLQNPMKIRLTHYMRNLNYARLS